MSSSRKARFRLMRAPLLRRRRHPAARRGSRGARDTKHFPELAGPQPKSVQHRNKLLPPTKSFAEAASIDAGSKEGTQEDTEKTLALTLHTHTFAETPGRRCPSDEQLPDAVYCKLSLSPFFSLSQSMFSALSNTRQNIQQEKRSREILVAQNPLLKPSAFRFSLPFLYLTSKLYSCRMRLHLRSRPFFPDICLSHDNGQWSVSTVNFVPWM